MFYSIPYKVEPEGRAFYGVCGSFRSSQQRLSKLLMQVLFVHTQADKL